MLVHFTIPLTPISKKNSQQILRNAKTGRPFIAPSKQYKEYEKAAARYVPNIGKQIDEPVNVQTVFYMPTRRKVDKANLEESIHDVLVYAGLLVDDNRDIIAGTDGSRVYYDKDRPRTEVTITMMGGYEQWTKKSK